MFALVGPPDRGLSRWRLPLSVAQANRFVSIGRSTRRDCTIPAASAKILSIANLAYRSRSIDESNLWMDTLSFPSSRDFRRWLTANHSQSDGIWLRIYKKDSGVATVSYAEALDQALCFGWIDGQKQPYDKRSWLQKFTPRRPKSGWSKNNTRHAERLMKSGDMAAAGLCF